MNLLSKMKSELVGTISTKENNAKTSQHVFENKPDTLHLNCQFRRNKGSINPLLKKRL
jgi:hypothetical protein